MKLTLGTSNPRALAANFFALDARCQAAARKLVDRVAHEQYALTAALCPRDTGRMLRLLKLRFGGAGLTYTIGWDEADFAAEGVGFYPVYTEFGTTKMAARPCLFPARDLVAPKYRRDLRAVVRAALKRRGGA